MLRQVHLKLTPLAEQETLRNDQQQTLGTVHARDNILEDAQTDEEIPFVQAYANLLPLFNIGQQFIDHPVTVLVAVAHEDVVQVQIAAGNFAETFAGPVVGRLFVEEAQDGRVLDQNEEVPDVPPFVVGDADDKHRDKDNAKHDNETLLVRSQLLYELVPLGDLKFKIPR